MKNNQLSPAIAAHFELRLLHPGKHILDTRYGGLEVDFRTITLARAQELASLPGFPYLVKKEKQSRVTLSAVEVPTDTENL